MLGTIKIFATCIALCLAALFQSSALANNEPAPSPEDNAITFLYRSVLPNQQHILKWFGKEEPKIGGQIKVTLDNKTVGTLSILKKNKATVLCKYMGEEISLTKLKDYRLQYLGIPSAPANEPQKSIFTPDSDLDKERLPQIAIGTQATFAHNDALDVAFNTALNREQNSLDAFLLLAPPVVPQIEWLNWFWLGASYGFNIQSNSRVVLGDQERNYYSLLDQPKVFSASTGFRVPTTISLLASLELYGIFYFENHEITLESKILDTTDKIKVDLQKTFLGAAYTIRLVDNLFLQFVYNQSVVGKLQISSSEKLLDSSNGTIDTQEFGVKPYIYYELWDQSPQLNLKFEIGMTQATNLYKLRSESVPDAQKEARQQTTRLEQLRVQPSIRLGLKF